MRGRDVPVSGIDRTPTSSITVRDAFDIMIAFLERYGSETHSDDLQELVLRIRYGHVSEIDGEPSTNTPGIWSDWMEAVSEALDRSS